MRSVDRELPFEPEVAFDTGARVHGYDRDEQVTGFDLSADFRIPGIAAAQFALVEPDLDGSGAQRCADSLRGLVVLRGVTEKDGARRFSHAGTTPAVSWRAGRGRITSSLVSLFIASSALECSKHGFRAIRGCRSARCHAHSRR